ncbi:hypothetical protein FJZ31_04210 [Candidatus Poribacteria bacterium]|nr:hypothetical protein [Candidatus Poribacteria bacterium]
MKKETIFSIFILFMLIGCASLRTTKIIPAIDQDATIFPKTGAVASTKNGIVVLAVPLNDVKEVDALGVIVVNETSNWLSFYKNKCVLLDQNGSTFNPLSKSEENFHLGKNFKPQLPPEFKMELFSWRHGIVGRGSIQGMPLEDLQKTLVMPGSKRQFFLYFKKRSVQSSRLTLIIPNIYNEVSDEKTTFAFKFEVQKG